MKNTVLQMIQAGKSHREIRDVTGVPLATISRWRNEGTESGQMLVFGDTHIPFHDPIVLELVKRFASEIKPKRIVIEGDFIDFYQLSRFDKDPDRRFRLQDDLDVAVNELSHFAQIAPIDYILGNHEARLKKDLWKNHSEYSKLRCLQFESLINAKELGITVHNHRVQIGDLTIIHGDVVRKHAGYSAKAHYDKYGCTMIHGHTHRDGKYTKRDLSGHKAVWENYCTCSLYPEYIEHPDWTQGFAVVNMMGDRPYVEQVPIIDGMFMYGGKVWK